MSQTLKKNIRGGSYHPPRSPSVYPNMTTILGFTLRMEDLHAHQVAKCPLNYKLLIKITTTIYNHISYSRYFYICLISLFYVMHEVRALALSDRKNRLDAEEFFCLVNQATIKSWRNKSVPRNVSKSCQQANWTL